jgi:hypothetical protein
LRKTKIIVLVLIAVILISGLVFFLVGTARPKGAGILIETNPQSSVFIDGELLGRTLYEEVRRPGEITVKLVPESFEKPLAPYETKVNLVSGVQTVIGWEFGERSELGSGEIVSFEKIGKDETALSVVTIPASSSVDIDGGTKVFTPYKTSSIAPGEHSLVFSSKGYLERPLRVKTVNGFKLTAVVQLAENSEFTEEIVSEAVNMEEKKIEVEILSTPVGFLRVRDEPSTLADEIGQVKPGERYPLVEEDEKTGWFKIEYQPSQEDLVAKEGWVSNTYAKKIENELIGTPTPTVKITPTPSI